jgi:transposase
LIQLGQLVPFIERTLEDIDTTLYLRRKRKRVASVPLAWLLSAVIWFNASGMTCWKRYVSLLLPLQLSRWKLSYSRWSFWRAELADLVVALAERLCIKRGFNGVSLIDATSLPVSSIQRERDHKCFVKHASKGRGSLGWFYGFKLHCIASSEGEILRFWLSTGKTHDTQPLFDPNFMRDLRGCLVGDSGYRVRKDRRADVAKGPELVLIARPAGVKDEELPWELRRLFKARWRVESMFSELKEHLGLRLTRRCKNLATLQVLVVSALIVYTLNRTLQMA